MIYKAMLIQQGRIFKYIELLFEICNNRNHDQLSKSKASSQIMSIQKMLQTANVTSTGETKEHRNYLLQLIKNHLNATQSTN
jgi:hypothetical protein